MPLWSKKQSEQKSQIVDKLPETEAGLSREINHILTQAQARYGVRLTEDRALVLMKNDQPEMAKKLQMVINKRDAVVATNRKQAVHDERDRVRKKAIEKLREVQLEQAGLQEEIKALPAWRANQYEVATMIGQMQSMLDEGRARGEISAQRYQEEMAELEEKRAWLHKDIKEVEEAEAGAQLAIAGLPGQQERNLKFLTVVWDIGRAYAQKPDWVEYIPVLKARGISLEIAKHWMELDFYGYLVVMEDSIQTKAWYAKPTKRGQKVYDRLPDNVNPFL